MKLTFNFNKKIKLSIATCSKNFYFVYGYKHTNLKNKNMYGEDEQTTSS